MLIGAARAVQNFRFLLVADQEGIKTARTGGPDQW
jgi:hypothetical protein